MKDIVKKLLHDSNYRKILHLIYSEKAVSPQEIKQQLNLEEESVTKVLNDFQESGIIEIKDDGIKKRLEDFMLIIDFKSGSVYVVISSSKAQEIRDIIEKATSSTSSETN